MRIVQTVFGVFHHFELARQLSQRGHLQKIYSTWPHMRVKREGLSRNLVATFPWIHTTEMLMLRMRISNPYLFDQTSYANAIVFDWWTASQVRKGPAPDALVGISGSSLKTGQELQASEIKTICCSLRCSIHGSCYESLHLNQQRPLPFYACGDCAST